jgi:hypothetical protein
MLWGEKSKIMLICYRCDSIDSEVRAAFSRRQATKHFSAQLDVRMYSFMYVLACRKEHPSRSSGQVAQSVEKKFSRSAPRLFLINRQPLLFH